LGGGIVFVRDRTGARWGDALGGDNPRVVRKREN